MKVVEEFMEQHQKTIKEKDKEVDYLCKLHALMEKTRENCLSELRRIKGGKKISRLRN